MIKMAQNVKKRNKKTKGAPEAVGLFVSIGSRIFPAIPNA